MTHTERQARSNYEGAAEIWIDDAKRFDVTVRLTGYVDVSVIETLGGVERMDGVHSWDGYVNGLTQNDLLELAVCPRWELRMPDGQTRQAVLPNGDRYLLGTGMTPFE